MTLDKKLDPVHALFSTLKEQFYFTYAVVWLIDKHNAVYAPFLPDQEAPYARHYKEPELSADMYPTLTDPLITKIMDADAPISLQLDKIISRQGTPKFLQHSYDNGIRNVLVTKLKYQKETIGFIVFSNRKTEGFADGFSSVLQGIVPLLSVVIRNIIINEPLLDHTPIQAVNDQPLKLSTIIGSGPEMQKVHQKMSLVAGSNSTVLILGETGTGKELFAHAIHHASPRRHMPMVKINCAALPANLIESELFGHEKGAFTGASDRRIGKFELANNGTLFLDEMGEMPLELQVKLLRVIQEREFERVGGKTTIKVDFRLIAATNRNLEEEVRQGRFREDLFYRLNVFPIHLPSLKQRVGDIEPLANFFLARFNKTSGRKIRAISPAVIRELQGYTWPGNVRELEHLMERSILMTQGDVLDEIQLPKHQAIVKEIKADLPRKTLQDIERSYIIEILRRYDGKISGDGGASQFLAIPATTLHSKMKKLGISKFDYLSKNVS